LNYGKEKTKNSIFELLYAKLSKAKYNMKIAFLSFYSGVVYRGVETYVHELSNRLVLLGHDVTVYQGGSKLPNAKYKTVSIKNSFFEKSVTKKNLFTNSLARTEAVRSFSIEALKQMNKSVDVVIATNNRFQALLCRYWTKKNKAKLVIHGQGGPGIDERIALWCFPDLFIPLSLYQKEWAERVNPFVKVSEVVHNGVDLEKFNAGTKAIKINLPKPIILCVGALWPMKRLHLLIKAVAKLKNASLLIVGEG
jgi:glycosyltransferase involved in cell wall biosynthesis